MKRKKNLLILFGVLAVLCLACIALLAQKKHEDSINTIDKKVFEQDPDDVKKVTWTYAGKTLAFEKQDDVWYSTDDKDFPVDQTEIVTFLKHFSTVHASFIIKDVEDYDQYGLKTPECTITFTTKDGDSTIKMGGYSTMDSKRYITVDDKEVYLIDMDLVEKMTDNRDDFMEQSKFDGISAVESCTVSGDNSLKIVYDDETNHTYADDYKYYLLDGKTYKALSTESAEDYIKTITGLGLTDYVTYKAEDSAKAKYGLNQPLMTIEMKGTTKELVNPTDDSEEAEEQTVDKSYVLSIGKAGSDYYLNMKDSPIIYRLDSDTYDSLKNASYDTLRPTEVLSLNWDKVSSLKFNLGEEDYAVEVTHKKQENTYKMEGKEIEFDDIIEDIDALSIESFQSEEPKKDIELSMSVNLEPSDDSDQAQTLQVKIYQYDGNDCLVLLDGECLGLMERSKMADLKEALQSLILNLDAEK